MYLLLLSSIRVIYLRKLPENLIQCQLKTDIRKRNSDTKYFTKEIIVLS